MSTESDAWRAAAETYLKETLADRAPAALKFESAFDESPLEGEGRTAIFSFDLEVSPTGDKNAAPESAAACPGRRPMKHYVAVGATTPNYFPAYEFESDDAYSLHIGTRFMLEMGLQKVGLEMAPPDAPSRLQLIINNFLATTPHTPPELTAVFACEDAIYTVYKLTVNTEPYYLMGGDCPPGFYALTQFPPQVALRLHIGKLIRQEAKPPASAPQA